MTKQSNYNVGIYVRLSQEDERAGESLSIENQKKLLTDYVSKQENWNLVEIFEDDGYSGTNFDRPGVQNLLDGAKTGRINLILVKDLSRFGRNYIEVGQYVDYIFPSYNIRFIALNDNVDTIDRNSTALEMMPIVNLFNEWHAASTSKKVRNVLATNAKQGKYIASFASYGYVKGNDKNHLPVIDPEAAQIVRRIFDLRTTGITPTQIAKIFNAEKIMIPSDYLAKKLGRENPCLTTHFWNQNMVRRILENQIYIGNLVQQRFTTVSFKNHKLVRKGEEEWVIVEHTHEPIISMDVWEKCREVDRSASRGKITKTGLVLPLNGLMYCPDCGAKVKQNGHGKNQRTGERNYFYTCGTYTRCGKDACTSHYISQKQIEKLVLTDIRAKAKLVIDDEETARQKFLKHKDSETARQIEENRQLLKKYETRLAELKKLTHSVYEDKLLGKIPEELCVETLEKYMTEQKSLTEKVENLKSANEQADKDHDDIEEFISRLKKYVDVQEVTREMCLEMIEYITIGERPESKSVPREVHIYYKFLDDELENKRNLYFKEK